MGLRINKRGLSEILGVSERSLTDWQKDGLPMIYSGTIGESNEYDTEAVIAWLIQREVRKVSQETPKDRLARLQADRVEIDIDEKLGKLISVEQIEPAWSAMVTAARSQLRAEPDRLAHLLEMTEGVDAKRDMIAETFDEFLRKLSSYSIQGDEEPAGEIAAAGDDEDGTAAEDDGRGMG